MKGETRWDWGSKRIRAPSVYLEADMPKRVGSPVIQGTETSMILPRTR